MSATTPMSKTMTAQAFAESPFVEIDEVDPGKYGLYPFQLIAFTKDNKLEVNALLLNDVRQCYDRCLHYLALDTTDTVFLAIDFPAILDMPHDFVAIHRIRPMNELDVILVPYNRETGERFPIVDKGTAVRQIEVQFGMYLINGLKDLMKQTTKR